MLRRFLAVLLATTAVLLPAAAAAEGDNADAFIDRQDVDPGDAARPSAKLQLDSTTAQPGTSSPSGGGGRGRGRGAPDCTTSSGQPGYTNYGGLMVTTQEEQRTQIRPWEQRPGRWAWQYCGDQPVDLVFLPDAAPVDPLVLAQSAREQLTPPLPRPRTNPTADRSQLVNLRTWLWIDPGGWQPLSKTASAGAVSATVTAVPSSVRWEMGDGAAVECRGPGTPYDPSRPESAQSTSCSHTYKRSSAGQANQRYTVRVTITYGVSWTVTGAPGGGDLGVIESSESLPLRVAEGQAIVVGR